MLKIRNIWIPRFTPYPNNKTITPRFIKIHHHNDSFAKAGCPTSTIDAKVIPATNNNILQITVKIHPLVFIITFLLYSMTGNKDKRLWLDNK
jgi:hypothetical protein